ncbi:MAG: hypothetical protein AAGC86_11175 [Pseudomonadota bacterium]
MISDPWTWIIAAVVLAALEVVIPGYVFLGFAIGAAAIGLLLGVGGPFAAWIAGSGTLLVLSFAVVSVLAWIGLRRWLSGGAKSVRRIENDINDD